MGIRYSASDAARLIEALTNNLRIADDINDRLSSGCEHLLAALDSGELQGAAYTAGRGLFSDVIIPAIKKLQEAIDDIQLELTAYQTANELVSKYGNLDLEELKELERLQEAMLQTVMKQIGEHRNFYNAVRDFSFFDFPAHLKRSLQLSNTQEQLETEIATTREKIRQLESFVRQVSPYFSDSLAVLSLAIRGATQLSQVLVDVDGSYTTAGLDMSWSAQMKGQVITNLGTSLNDLTTEDALYAQNLMSQYGFNQQTAREILKVRDGIAKNFPTLPQQEKDYLLLRILGSVSYGAVEGLKEEFMWDATAGSLGKYFYKDMPSYSNPFGIVEMTPIRVEMPFTEIMTTLGLSEAEGKHLYATLYFQHRVSGALEELDSYDVKDLKKYAKTVSKNYKDLGIYIDREEIQSVAKGMYQKADFTHQSITMATHLRPTTRPFGDDQLKDLSGWEGDTTRNAGNDVSIGADDYIADLDAVNISQRMAKGQTYIQALNLYMHDLEEGKTTREIEFKSHISLEEVKQTIFDGLIPKEATAIRLSNKEALAYLKVHYPSSYLFIQSLEQEKNLFVEKQE